MVRAMWRDSAPQFTDEVDMTGLGTTAPSFLPEPPGLPGTLDFPDQPSYPDPVATQGMFTTMVRWTCWISGAAE